MLAPIGHRTDGRRTAEEPEGVLPAGDEVVERSLLDGEVADLAVIDQHGRIVELHVDLVVLLAQLVELAGQGGGDDRGRFGHGPW